ncbi:jg25670, partial [Pararge aegeria aegeria]
MALLQKGYFEYSRGVLSPISLQLGSAAETAGVPARGHCGGEWARAPDLTNWYRRGRAPSPDVHFSTSTGPVEWKETFFIR